MEEEEKTKWKKIHVVRVNLRRSEEAHTHTHTKSGRNEMKENQWTSWMAKTKSQNEKPANYNICLVLWLSAFRNLSFLCESYKNRVTKMYVVYQPLQCVYFRFLFHIHRTQRTHISIFPILCIFICFSFINMYLFAIIIVLFRLTCCVCVYGT